MKLWGISGVTAPFCTPFATVKCSFPVV